MLRPFDKPLGNTFFCKWNCQEEASMIRFILTPRNYPAVSRPRMDSPFLRIFVASRKNKVMLVREVQASLISSHIQPSIVTHSTLSDSQLGIILNISQVPPSPTPTMV